MGSKVVIFCDLCKQESEDNFTKLSFTKSGKRNAQKFEVCSACSEKVMTQLVSENTLPPSWTFNSSVTRQVTEDDTIPDRGSRREQIEALQPDYDDDDIFVASKRKQRREPDSIEKVTLSEDDYDDDTLDIRTHSGGPETVQMIDNAGDCYHPNKGRAKLLVVDGVRGFFHRCNDCQQVMPAKSTEERAASIQATPSKGMREGQNSDVRKKNQ